MDFEFNPKLNSIPVEDLHEESMENYTENVNNLDLEQEETPTLSSLADEILSDNESYDPLYDEDVDIIGGLYERNNPNNDNKKKERKEIVYGTTQVAQMLGITPQTVRNYLRDYNDFLEVEIVSTGSTERAQFTRDKIEELRELIRVKDENNFTTDKMRAYMADPTHLGYVPESKKYDKTVELMLNTMRSILEENAKSYNLLMEKNESAYTKAIDDLTSTVNEQKEQLNSLKELINNQSDALNKLQDNQKEAHEKEIATLNDKFNQEITDMELSYSKEKQLLADEISEKESKIDTLEKDNSSLSSSIESLNKELDALNEKNDKLQDELKALQEKKRGLRRLFGK